MMSPSVLELMIHRNPANSVFNSKCTIYQLTSHSMEKRLAGGYSDASSSSQTSDGGYMSLEQMVVTFALIKTDAKGNVILIKRFKGP